jgi:hypothetical protein
VSRIIKAYVKVAIILIVNLFLYNAGSGTVANEASGTVANTATVTTEFPDQRQEQATRRSSAILSPIHQLPSAEYNSLR